eukprot:snap_masked-scaffold_13-processed-gene-8.60-mRNA-1 protein AED:1.00 eAED:1.00 QI:0/-1/0/0/-1/1/1/0/371
MLENSTVEDKGEFSVLDERKVKNEPIRRRDRLEQREYFAHAARKYRKKAKAEEILLAKNTEEQVDEVEELRSYIARLNEVAAFYEAVSKKSHTANMRNLLKRNASLRVKLVEVKQKEYLYRILGSFQSRFPKINSRLFFLELKKTLQKIIDTCSGTTIDKYGKIEFNNQSYYGAKNRNNIRRRVNASMQCNSKNRVRARMTNLAIDRDLSKFIKFTIITKNIGFDKYTNALEYLFISHDYDNEWEKLYEIDRKLLDIDNAQPELFRFGDCENLPYQRIVVDRFLTKATGEVRISLCWIVKTETYFIFSAGKLIYDETDGSLKMPSGNFWQYRVVKDEASDRRIKATFIGSTNPMNRLQDAAAFVKAISMMN